MYIIAVDRSDLLLRVTLLAFAGGTRARLHANTRARVINGIRGDSYLYGYLSLGKIERARPVTTVDVVAMVDITAVM